MTSDPVSAAARLAAIRSATIRAAEEYVRTRIWLLEEQAVALLGQLYLDAYRSMAGQLAEVMARTGDVWRASDLAFRARTEALLQGISADMARLTDQVVAAVLESAIRGYQAGFYGRAWLLEQGVRAVGAIHLPILPVEAIRAAVLQPYQGSTFLDRFIDARTDFERRIRSAIVQSQIQGESIGQATRRLQRELGLATGRAAAGGHHARVEMIARTEVLRASNAGAMAIYEANADVLAGWEWLATRDERTCPICGALDGQVFMFNSRQSAPPAHPRCRCTPVPRLKNESLEARIVGKRETYREWAARRGISIVQDGGVLHFQRGKPAPRAPSLN